jgi:hypothetical protein
MAFKFRWRKGFPVLPFLRFNVTEAGRTSWTWHLGRLWSYNTRTGQHRFNPPGPGSFVGSTRAQRERKRAGESA